jgi:hypothetical protein
MDFILDAEEIMVEETYSPICINLNHVDGWASCDNKFRESEIECVELSSIWLVVSRGECVFVCLYLCMWTRLGGYDSYNKCCGPSSRTFQQLQIKDISLFLIALNDRYRAGD